MHSLVPIGAGCLVCMMPLALYFLYLSYLHQRRHPTVISGPWDFACVLLGLSGFLVMGGLILLATIDSTWRRLLFKGSFRQIQIAWHAEPLLWSVLASGYVIMLTLIILLCMRQRRRWITVYNADRALIEETLIEVIDALGHTSKRIGTGLEIGARKSKEEESNGKSFRSFRAPAQIQVDSFEAMNHVSIRWRNPPSGLQDEVIGELTKSLTNWEAPESSVAGWFLTTAVTIFFVMLLWMIFLIYTVMTAPR